MQLGQSCLQDLPSQELRPSIVTGLELARASLTPRLAKESAAPSLPSQRHRSGLEDNNPAVATIPSTASRPCLDAQDATGRSEALIAPARSLGTGLLLEPPLDLSSFSREAFERMAATVGPHRIRRPWSNAVVAWPPHASRPVNGLTEDDVKRYMARARMWFDQGNAVPASDVGLVSTQEDVIRQPMLNHIAAFSNDVARVYLLVQKTASDQRWSYYSIVQDLTRVPALDYFAELTPKGPKFEAASCIKCHASGPLAIHPAREDLVLDARLAAALSRHIEDQPRSRMFFPPGEKPPANGLPLEIPFCARCHGPDGDRAPLHQLQSHSIRVLVDFGYMPPNRRLTAPEVAELKAWLEKRP
jgi:mono/diheme cytochrome c family protein